MCLVEEPNGIPIPPEWNGTISLFGRVMRWNGMVSSCCLVEEIEWDVSDAR